MSSPTLPHVTFLDLSHDEPETARELARRLARLAELALKGLNDWAEHSTPIDGDLAGIHELASGARYFAGIAQRPESPRPDDVRRRDDPKAGGIILPFRARQEPSA